MSDQTEIVIASGARTPIGAFSGSFATLPAHALGAAAIKGVHGAGRPAGGAARGAAAAAWCRSC